MKWKIYYGKRAIIFKFICKCTQFIYIFTQIPRKIPTEFCLENYKLYEYEVKYEIKFI